MNVLFFVPASIVYGSENKMLSIMVDLKSKGYNVACVINGWNDGKYKKMLVENNIKYYEVKLGFFYLKKPLWTLDSLRHLPGAMFKVKRILKIFNPDFLYHNSYRTLFLLFPLIKKHKNIYHVGDINPVNRKNLFFFRSIRSCVTAYIASSKAIFENLIRLGVKRERLRLIMNGVKTPVVNTRQINTNDPIRIGYIGRISQEKGFSVLLQALNNLKSFSFTCNVYGEGETAYMKKMQEFIIYNDLQSHINFKGYQNDKAKIYSDMDLAVQPSYYEAFGISAVEPQLAGIPVVACNVGGLKEIVIDGFNGYLFEPGDSDRLSELLEKFILNKVELQKLGENAVYYSNKEFHFDSMMAKIQNLLNELQ